MTWWRDDARYAHLEATIRGLEATNSALRATNEKLDGLANESLRESNARWVQLLATREQLAALRSSFEWLTTHVTKLEEERSQLLARVLGVSFPAMQIAVPAGYATTPAGSAHDQRIHGVPLADSYESTVPGTQVATSMFEDMGDDDAHLAGVGHDPTGNVRYTRP